MNILREQKELVNLLWSEKVIQVSTACFTLIWNLGPTELIKS